MTATRAFSHFAGLKTQS